MPASDRWSERDIDANGVRLHIHRTGCGERPPIVLAHGLSDNGLCWTRVALALQSDYDVVMLDARNHGRSATAPASPSMLADDVAAVIDVLGFDRPAVMGHSVGAHTMAVLAGSHPDLVSRLILEDPPWTADRENVADHVNDAARIDKIRRWLGSFSDMTDEAIVELGRIEHPDWPAVELPMWVESNRQVRTEAAQGLSLGGWADVVTRIDCPTLLIHGVPDRDGMVTPEVAVRIKGSNDQVEAYRVERAGHNIRRENFDSFMDAVGTFLGHHRAHA